eukprot:s1204_g16.t1
MRVFQWLLPRMGTKRDGLKLEGPLISGLLAGKHLPKDADSGGAVVHLLLAVAAVSEQLAQDESSEEVAA